MEVQEKSHVPKARKSIHEKFWFGIKLVKILIILVILALDPFGLTSASDTASANVVNKILSLYYSEAAQQQITVVLIDDTSLDSMGTHWPLSYQQQAKLYRSILNYQPKALFIDLLYTHDRSNEQDQIIALNNTFERYQHVPVYLPRPMQPSLQGSPKLQYINPVFVQWYGTEHYYPRQFKEMPSPAQAMYQLHCKQAECNSKQSEKPPVMAIQWGSKLSDIQQRFSDTQHCRQSISSGLSIIKILVSDIFWKTTKEWLQPCPYHTTVNAAQLMANDDSARQLFNKLIRDKYVLFGAYIQGARDEVHSPIHGKIPGVYLHAMALDNLLTYDERHYRPPHEIIGNLNISDLVDALFFVLFMLMKDMLSTPADRKKSSMKVHWYQTWRLAAVMAILMFITALLFATVLHYEPINWLGLSALFLIISYQKFISYRLIFVLRWMRDFTKKKI